MTDETESRGGPHEEPTAKDDAKREPYAPPEVQEIDTTHDAAETAGGGPGVSPGGSGVEEGSRWH
jgi:hypothetical protein